MCTRCQFLSSCNDTHPFFFFSLLGTSIFFFKISVGILQWKIWDRAIETSSRREPKGKPGISAKRKEMLFYYFKRNKVFTDGKESQVTKFHRYRTACSDNYSEFAKRWSGISGLFTKNSVSFISDFLCPYLTSFTLCN